MQDYNKPQAPASLLKAALICAGVVSVDPAALPLEAQLKAKVGGGLEIESWSDLPQGSGMGTSSILAGAVLAAISKASGHGPEGERALVDGVLQLEQTLTTGGGWQDQVGGIVPGAKIARSEPSLPLRVNIEHLETPPGFLEVLSDHMVLVYTGRTRLAKDILQNVLRRWNARIDESVDTMRVLTTNAEDCAEALRVGDIGKVGRCLGAYWVHKKAMAQGCEPEECRAMIAALEQQGVIHGASLTGAGGGGFMALVTKQPKAIRVVQQVFDAIPGFQKDVVTLHEVAIDAVGLLQRVEIEAQPTGV